MVLSVGPEIFATFFIVVVAMYGGTESEPVCKSLESGERYKVIPGFQFGTACSAFESLHNTCAILSIFAKSGFPSGPISSLHPASTNCWAKPCGDVARCASWYSEPFL